MKNTMQVYKEMSAEDKAALKALKEEEEKRTGKALTLREVLDAVLAEADYNA